MALFLSRSELLHLIQPLSNHLLQFIQNLQSIFGELSQSGLTIFPIDDRFGIIVFYFLGFNLLVTVDGEVLILFHDLLFGNKEALIRSLAAGSSMQIMITLNHIRT